MKEYPCQIEPMYELGSIVGYLTRGHHDDATFAEAVRRDYARKVDPSDIVRCHFRLLPPNEDGDQWYWPSEPGRGAFPVTFTEYTKPIEVSPCAT